MPTTITDPISVLVVDDDPEFTDLYQHMLSSDCHVTSANSAEEALSCNLDTFDVILLDRKMPDASGDEILERLRRQGVTCPVAMVTATEPDLDIVDLPFDEYIQKPVGVDDLRASVRRLAYRGSLEVRNRQFSQLVAKKASLDSSDCATEDAPEYEALIQRIESLQGELGKTMAEVATETVSAPHASIQAEESAQLIQQVFEHELPNDLAELIETYQELPDARPHFVWKWVHRLAPQNTLPCVEAEYWEKVPVDKTITILFITLLDDCLEKRRDRLTFSELRRIPDPDQTPDTDRLGVESEYVAFTQQVWNTLMERISKAPQFDAYIDLFYHDIDQAMNAVSYSSIPIRTPDLATMGDLERIETHNMGMYAYADIDLMHSPPEARQEVPPIREALWDAQLMARIGNWISTWERELEEGDFSSGPVVYAREQGIVSREELERLTGDSGADVEEIVERIRDAGVEQEFFRRWEQHYYQLYDKNRKIETFDLTPFIDGMEEVLRYHLASTGLK